MVNKLGISDLVTFLSCHLSYKVKSLCNYEFVLLLYLPVGSKS